MRDGKINCNGLIPSMVIWPVTMPDALLVTEYWYTPGSTPVTVSVLRYRLF